MERIYIGMDIHRKFSSVSVQKLSGEILMEKRLAHDDLDSFREFFNEHSDASVTMEATCGWSWIVDELQEIGLDVHLAHPSGVRAIAVSTHKTDKLDAKTLGNLLRSNFLPEAYLAPNEVRDNRQILRYRTALVRIRASIKNRIHALLIKVNYAPNGTNPFTKVGRKKLEELALNETNRIVLDGWLTMIDFMDIQIKEVEDEIKKRLKEDPRTDILQSMPGIGYLTAYTIIAEVGDINRFSSADKFSCYCGLVPSTRQSADKIRYGKLVIGRKTLKWNLVEATHTAIRYDQFFKKLYYRYKKSDKHKTRAVIATAHKMARIIYRMLKDNRSYQKPNDEKKIGSNAPMAS